MIQGGTGRRRMFVYERGSESEGVYMKVRRV